ncbi:MAG: DUF2085 domain-containing protein [Chloroflexi bacterium]|nr:DUF2085 domain-containing protein [Chloroflexota bacterium]
MARFTSILNGFVQAVARHWLLLANASMGCLVGLPIVAPVLMHAGYTRAARLIYTLSAPLCHQLPERSFFLFGPKFSYTLKELQLWLGPNVPLRYIGDRTLGYKIALCERDMAIFSALFLTGLAFALVRHRLQPLSARAFAVLCLPIAIDGLGQLLTLWDSTWWSRVFSGGLFGVACAWLAYPHIEAGMNQVRRAMESLD